MSTVSRTAPAWHRSSTPLNCSIFLTDIAGFGDRRRTDDDRLALRAALQRLLVRAFEDCGVPWSRCLHQDRGDGLLTVVPPTVSTVPLVDPLLPRLGDRLRRYNRRSAAGGGLRLRSALHVGPVRRDGSGFPNESIIFAARLLDARPLRLSLAESDTDLATMVSPYVYETVVQQLRGAVTPTAFRRTRCTVKGVPITGWIRVSRPG
ncbi:hypothetical protein ABZS66_57865 [Dactylosporangium sp. NPDC005572]|uniref:hypothetical protein n=1 Tax=Dactylosporangium sp. NPDC005572 TaxID=3156889 RepID=UPI0033B53FF5